MESEDGKSGNQKMINVVNIIHTSAHAVRDSNLPISNVTLQKTENTEQEQRCFDAPSLLKSSKTSSLQ